MNCKDCKELIQHPICAECLENEIMIWMQETNPELLNSLKVKSYEIRNFNFTTNTTCILCKQYIDICSNCYCEHIKYWLKNQPAFIGFVNIFKTYLTRPNLRLSNWQNKIETNLETHHIFA